ncbi:unnamed protein product [Amaranthus hypochondriacus]
MACSLSLGEAMAILNEAFTRTRRVMEGYPDVKFSSEEYQRFYQCVYSLCVQRTAHENSKMLYDRYKIGLEECINSLVLPYLDDKSGTILLTELLVKWSSYQLMAKWLSRFFHYLDRFYIPRVGAFGLLELAIRTFHNLVNPRYQTKLVAAAVFLIHQNRNGVMIDGNLLKKIVEYFDVAQTMGGTCYDEFENTLLATSATYYSQIASHCLVTDSYADYMYKVQCFLEQENERANGFLNPSSKDKLMQVVKSCLVEQVLPKLHEKQQAENHDKSTDFQDLISKCAGLNLGDRSSDPNWNMVHQP